MGFLRNAKMLVFLIGLGFVASSYAQYKSPEYVKYVDDVIFQYKKVIRNKFGLHCTGSGGKMPYNVESIAIGFNCKKHVSVSEARELFINCTDDLILLMNSHVKLRQFLKNYPVNYASAEINIDFTDNNGHCYTDGSVAFVFQAKGKIFYRAQDPATGSFVPILEEPYEEAEKIVKSGRSQ